MIETLYQHTCDQCGKVHIEKGGFGGNGNWIQGWFRVDKSTSQCYGVTASVSENFCSIKCLYEWAWKQQEVKK